VILWEAGTGELTEAPKGANIVSLKWVFHAKKDAAGIVVHHKAHLVVQGFSQVPGVDYFDTFAPIAKLTSIWAILAMATMEDMELHQIDIKGAYLNGELTKQETIYMSQPPVYPAPNSTAKFANSTRHCMGSSSQEGTGIRNLLISCWSLGFRGATSTRLCSSSKTGTTWW
jgi:Reverse transcriptase (RNA-dependent DNA polymerase)